MNEKLIKKLTKALGQDTLNDMRGLSIETLDGLIVSSAKEIEETREELEANPSFQKVKEDMKYLRSGLAEVKKLNNARIQAAIMLLSERGKVV